MTTFGRVQPSTQAFSCRSLDCARTFQNKMAAVSSVCLPEIKRDLLYAVKECSERGLLHSAKW